MCKFPSLSLSPPLLQTGRDAVPEIFPEDESKQYDESDHVVTPTVHRICPDGGPRLFSAW